MLEQYLDGDEYTVNGFLLEREYFPMSVTRRLLYPPPPLGVCIAHRYPSLLANEEPLFELAHKASLAVGLETGPSYVQVRMRDGQPWAIEVGARLGGGKDAELAKLVTGFDAVRANVLWVLGELARDDLQPGEPTASGRPGALRGRGAGAHRPARARLPPWRSTASTRRAGTGERG